MKIKLPFVEFDLDGAAACSAAGCASIAMLLVFGAVAYGFTPISRGFASAESVSREIEKGTAEHLVLKNGQDNMERMLKSALTQVRSDIRESQIIGMHQRECEARAARQMPLVAERVAALEKLLREFREVAGVDYPDLRPCP